MPGGEKKKSTYCKYLYLYLVTSNLWWCWVAGCQCWGKVGETAALCRSNSGPRLSTVGQPDPCHVSELAARLSLPQEITSNQCLFTPLSPQPPPLCVCVCVRTCASIVFAADDLFMRPAMFSSACLRRCKCRHMRGFLLR